MFTKTFIIFMIFGCVRMQSTQFSAEDAANFREMFFFNSTTNADNLQDKVVYITRDLFEASHSLNQLTENIFTNYQTQITQTGYFLESVTGKLLNFNISEKTCGILNLTENAKTIFDAGRICTLKNYPESVQDVKMMITEVAGLSKERAEIENEVKNCLNPKNNHMTISEIDKCVKRAEELANKMSNDIETLQTEIQEKEQNHLLASIKKCLIAEGGKILWDKSKHMLDCYTTRNPDFAERAEQIKQIMIYIEHFAGQNFKNIRKYVSQAVQVIRKHIWPLLKRWGTQLKKWVTKLLNYLEQTKLIRETKKNLLTKMKQWIG